MTYTIYHNPKCSKSRNAVKLLEEKGADFKVIEYLEKPLKSSELKSLFAKGDFELKEAVRPKEAKEEGNGAAEIKSMSETELINFIAKNPRVMQRPIVSKNGKAVIARDDDWFTRL